MNTGMKRCPKFNFNCMHGEPNIQEPEKEIKPNTAWPGIPKKETTKNDYREAIALCDKIIQRVEKENKRLALLACELKLQIQLESKRQDPPEWTPEDILKNAG